MEIKQNLRYWDSVTFLGYLQEETGKVEKCRGVIQSAENHQIHIVTSALTIAEVIYLKGRTKITRAESAKICNFFKHEYVLIVNVDRYLAENARELLWAYPALKPPDAIHVATAIKAKVFRMDTFDKDLIKLSGLIGNPPLIIGYPDIPFQGKLF